MIFTIDFWERSWFIRLRKLSPFFRLLRACLSCLRMEFYPIVCLNFVTLYIEWNGQSYIEWNIQIISVNFSEFWYAYGHVTHTPLKNIKHSHLLRHFLPHTSSKSVLLPHHLRQPQPLIIHISLSVSDLEHDINGIMWYILLFILILGISSLFLFLSSLTLSEHSAIYWPLFL